MMVWVAGTKFEVRNPIILQDGAGNDHTFYQSDIVVYAGCRMYDNVLYRLFNVNGTILRSNRSLQLEYNLIDVSKRARKGRNRERG